MIIKTRKQLSNTLQSITRLKARQTALGIRLEIMNNAVLKYFKKKHRTKYVDKNGTIWQQMQGSVAVYDDDAFKTLLMQKGIDRETVYKTSTVETRDDAAITQLLKENKVTIEEWKTVAKIKYHTPYLRRFEPRPNKGGGDDTDSDSGLPANKAFSRIRDSSETNRNT